MLKKKQQPAPVSTTNIIELPPTVFCCIFQYLPLEQLVKVSRISRRFKVLSYQDDIYRKKIAILGMTAVLDDRSKDRKLNSRDSLLSHLRLLPGGQYLPGAQEALLKDLDTPISSKMDGHESSSDSVTTAAPPTKMEQDPSILIENMSLLPFNTTSPTGDQKISAALPEFSKLIIGAGGLKAALAKQNNSKNVKGKKKVTKSTEQLAIQQPLVSKKPARDAFKQIFMELQPYYFNFRDKQTDSKVFRDFKDPSEVGAILSRLRYFDKARFFSQDTDDISFAIQTSSEWFESTLLGQFEVAYDAHNMDEMKKTAFAAYHLNGGMALVSLFISKNPVFFDHSFNPSLLSSVLPTLTGPSMGFAFSDEFAKYMDHMLKNCEKQVEIVSKVFVPDVDAMTLFINKVFEDSISEYLSAILAAAKAREDLYVYLNSLASSIYVSIQFLDHIVKNPFNVKVDPEPIKVRIRDIFSHYV